MYVNRTIRVSTEDIKAVLVTLDALDRSNGGFESLLATNEVQYAFESFAKKAFELGIEFEQRMPRLVRTPGEETP